MKYSRFALWLLSPIALAGQPELRYPIVDASQKDCFDNRRVIPAPSPAQPFYGQDAQFAGNAPSYTVSDDKLTVKDNVTNLFWQRIPDVNGDGKITPADKLTFSQAKNIPGKLNAARFGGYDDWRLPSIKELYSLFNANGLDPGNPNNPMGGNLKPFIDTAYFPFVYGDSSAGERIIDSQYGSQTLYSVKDPVLGEKLFGVNFADGRIKGYDLSHPSGREMTFYFICVRGNPNYGKNDFVESEPGIINDRATGHSWTRKDSEKPFNWRDALEYAQKMNSQNHLGHNDWRLPDVKELQSLVDYSKAPDSTHSPAINPLFECTTLKNAVGQDDYPYYWSSTTHANPQGGPAAMYIAFGRASGWMTRPQSPNDFRYVDVHGAGAQRSDPKEGDSSLFPHGRGPQGDVIRISNYVRLVRGGKKQN